MTRFALLLVGATVTRTAALASILALLTAAASFAGVADDLRGLIRGKEMRIAWLREVNDNNKFLGWGEYRLMAYDTRTGQERDVLGSTARRWRVKLSTDGRRIGYDTQYDLYVVDWDGSNNRKLLSGAQMGAFWHDKARNKHYVFCYKGKSVVRVDVDNPSDMRTVYTGEVFTGYLSVSADGRKLGGEWPRLRHGIVDTETGQFTQYHDDECWSTITPDNTYRFLVFTSNHRKYKVFSSPWNVSHELVLNEAPGIDGKEVYHPRFSVNDASIISVSGPYPNGLGGDASAAEILVGRANGNLTTMESWVYVTGNGSPDYHPSVWVDTDGAANTVQLSATRLTVQCTEGHLCSDVGTITVTNLSSTPQVEESSAWLTVSVDGSGSTRTLRHGIDATALSAGDYTAQATVIDGLGGSSVSYTVGLTVQPAQATLAAIEISPTGATIDPNQSLQLSASFTDEDGAPFAVSTPQWSVSGGGTVTPDESLLGGTQHTATFTSNGTLGEFTLTVSADGRSATTTVTVKKKVETVTLTGPAPGTSFDIGEQVIVEWEASDGVASVIAEVSFDDGKSWFLITKAGGIAPIDENWGRFVWTIPSTLSAEGGDPIPTASRDIRLRVSDYFYPQVNDELDGTIHITATLVLSGAVTTGGLSGRPLLAFPRGERRIVAGFDGPYRLEVLDAQGRCLQSFSAARPGIFRLDTSVPPGRYMVRARHAAGVIVRSAVLTDRCRN